MLDEHTAVRAATERLGDVARAEKNLKVARLAEQLMLHARSEEEVFSPPPRCSSAIWCELVLPAHPDHSGPHGECTFHRRRNDPATE